jgi:hypothetical protein
MLWLVCLVDGSFIGVCLPMGLDGGTMLPRMKKSFPCLLLFSAVVFLS